MFGVCYYPEHWSKSVWSSDARKMADLGLSYVRIAEFAWSRMEPRAGDYDFEWLDEAIDVLAGAGLKVVMCTPTATPPKWLVDKWPEVLPVDPDTGRVRGFGSRRHYDFSSDVYRNESLRITEVLAQRYGEHDAVAGWQTDNELCCHLTTLSASDTARRGFQDWCRKRYGTIAALNEAWGNVFWSMEYQNFVQIELPVGAVTETSPAHRLAYHRYSSDRVVEFHNAMVDVIRRHAPGRFITHNFIPMAETDVDNFALAGPLDFASYDNYPLGRTDLHFAGAPAEEFRRYMRTGHPDLSTYTFDQTRCLTPGHKGFWVMEQQPGPVNWAASNPRPAPGMIRLWTLEAFAHGATCVSYFRWRQAPFAQEQMHAGLLRPDSSEAGAWAEVEQAIAEAAKLDIDALPAVQSSVAIVTSSESFWLASIERQSEHYHYDEVQFDYYRALRELGVTVDFVGPDADLSGYSLVVVPCLAHVDDAFVARCQASPARFVFGPRTGAKSDEFSIPPNLPPGRLQSLVPVKVLSVETLRPDCAEPLHWQGREYASTTWCEELDPGGGDVVATYANGGAAAVRRDRFVYLGTLTGREFLRDFLRAQCDETGVATLSLAEDVRVQQRGNLCFAFNYAEVEHDLPIDESATLLLGSRRIKPRDVTVWTR
ncbi:MAG: beta-galactosidase [Pseudomonadota bacterium]